MDASGPSALVVTRRGMIAALTAVPAAAQAVSTVPPQGSPVPAPSGASPDAKLQKAYSDIRDVSERLRKITIPMTLEPAFAFRP